VSQEHERLLLGSLVLHPGFLHEYPIKMNDFSIDRHRRAFELITEIDELERPTEINPQMLAERLGDGNGFIAGLLTGLPRVTPELFAYNLREARRDKVLRSLKGTLYEQAPARELDTAGFRALLEEYDEVAGAGRPDAAAALRKGSELQVLDIHIEWLIDRLIPRNSVTMLHGPGGIGKTWVLLQAAKAISIGADFLGMRTQQRPVVFVALEDPLPILVERVRHLDIREVNFWCLGANPRPPKLDTPEYSLYQKLPAGSLIVLDTLRSAHDGDENSSKDISLVMGRLKELREAGFDIIINHHTGKASDRVYKGSTAISDLSDHVLSLYKVRKGTYEEIEDDSAPGPDDFFRLGTTQKTRYEPHHVFLNFSLNGGFLLAQDPDEEALVAIRGFIRTADEPKTQLAIVEFAKKQLEITKKGKVIDLLKKGERRFWHSRKEGYRRLYESVWP
jgi:hypothetical protein